MVRGRRKERERRKGEKRGDRKKECKHEHKLCYLAMLGTVFDY
jgi:hypothetical protein